MRKNLRMWAGVAVLPTLWACSSRPPEPPVTNSEPIGLQMLRTEAQLSKYPFFTLLSFERETDPVFIRVEGATARLDPSRSHTGDQSLQLPVNARAMNVKLSSLHAGRPWPGDWTLLGAYFYCQNPQRLTASYEQGGATLASYTIELPGGQWTPVLIDIAAALDGKSPTDAGSLRFAFPAPLSQPLWCDDVLEMNNNGTLVDTHQDLSAGWTIRERGFAYRIERGGAFRLVIKTPEADRQGWKLEEANEIRARFSRGAAAGGQASRIIYASGREYIDGKFHALDGSRGDVLAAQDAAPGQITMALDTGRVDRNTPGDANNDGYSEATGTYELIANGPRLELQIAPTSANLVCPVLEIAKLPPGKVLATMDGKLIERIVRLEDGRVLIELPGTVQRGVSVSVRVTNE